MSSVFAVCVFLYHSCSSNPKIGRQFQRRPPGGPTHTESPHDNTNIPSQEGADHKLLLPATQLPGQYYTVRQAAASTSPPKVAVEEGSTCAKAACG